MNRAPIALNHDWFVQPVRRPASQPAAAPASANDNWLSQFVASPSEIPMDDDHDDIPEDEFRPSVVTFVLAALLVVIGLGGMIAHAVGQVAT